MEIYKMGTFPFKIKSWKLQFFVLTQDKGLLRFRKPEEKSSREVIQIIGSTISSVHIKNKDFAIKIKFKKGGNALLATESQCEKDEWLDAF